MEEQVEVEADSTKIVVTNSQKLKVIPINDNISKNVTNKAVSENVFFCALLVQEKVAKAINKAISFFIYQAINFSNRGNVYILHICNLLKIGVKHTHLIIFIIN